LHRFFVALRAEVVIVKGTAKIVGSGGVAYKLPAPVEPRFVQVSWKMD